MNFIVAHYHLEYRGRLTSLTHVFIAERKKKRICQTIFENDLGTVGLIQVTWSAKFSFPEN